MIDLNKVLHSPTLKLLTWDIPASVYKINLACIDFSV